MSQSSFFSQTTANCTMNHIPYIQSFATSSMAVHEGNQQISSERDVSQTIAGLQSSLDVLDSCWKRSLKCMDDLLRSSRQRVPLTRLDTTSKFALFRQARSLWKAYYLNKTRGPKREKLIETQIVQLEYHLRQLQHQRDEVTTELMKLRASISASRRMPPEIWSMIFQYTISDGEGYTRPNIRSGPLLLSRVSRYWRNVAISTPRLWNSISIVKGSCGPSLLQIWFQRSGTLPLSIEISISPHMELNYDYRTLSLILSYSERWSRVRLNLTDNLLRSVLSTPMPNLEILEFGSNYAISTLNLTHCAAPKLRTVTLLTVPLDPAPLFLPWNQLTHFSSRCWADVQSHLDVLKRCPNLEKCRIHLLHAQSPPFDSPLVMPNIQSLEVVAFDGRAMDSILDRLVLPSLVELSLVVPDESPACGVSGWPRLGAYSLAERSACRMVRVCLRGIEAQDQDENDIMTDRLLVVEMSL